MRSIAMVIAILIAGLALLGTGCGQQSAPVAPPTTQAGAQPKLDPRLTLANNSGRYHFEGVVADEATRQSLLRSLESVYGGDVGGTIAIDPNTRPAAWATPVDKLLLAFRIPGGMLEFHGNRIELSGAVPEQDRATLLRTARELYPDHALTGLFEGADASHALPRAESNAALLANLNRIPIAFQADSGLVTASSLDGISRAAGAIKGASNDLRLQVGVYPERSDMPDYDRDIALQRANSIKVQLAIRGVSPGRIDTALLEGDAKGKPGRVEFAIAEVLPRGLASAGFGAGPEAGPEADSPPEDRARQTP